MKKQGKINRYDDKIIIGLVVFIVCVVVDIVTGYMVATSDLPFWVKFWFFS